MTFCVENETDQHFAFDESLLVSLVGEKVLEVTQCPYEAEVNVVITDLDGIRTYNRDFRQIDRETDVLSFPAIHYPSPADFSQLEGHEAEYFNPDSGELFLGDIMLCAQKVLSQAEEYGHTVKREFAFLIAHSMLHLVGYDHMTKPEEEQMYALQEKILEELGITRES